MAPAAHGEGEVGELVAEEEVHRHGEGEAGELAAEEELDRQLQLELELLQPRVQALEEGLLRAGPPVRLWPPTAWPSPKPPPSGGAAETRPRSHSEVIADLLTRPLPALAAGRGRPAARGRAAATAAAVLPPPLGEESACSSRGGRGQLASRWRPVEMDEVARGFSLSAPSDADEAATTPSSELLCATPLAPEMLAPETPPPAIVLSPEARSPELLAPSDVAYDESGNQEACPSRLLASVLAAHKEAAREEEFFRRQAAEWRWRHGLAERGLAAAGRERTEQAQQVAGLRAALCMLEEEQDTNERAILEGSLHLEAVVRSLEAECAEQAAALPAVARARRLEQSLEAQVDALGAECSELEGRLLEAERAPRRSTSGLDVGQLEDRLVALEAECASQEAGLFEGRRAEQEARRAEHASQHWQAQAGALQASCAEREAELLGVQRAQQRSLRAADDLSERLGAAAAANQRLQAELEAARHEVGTLASARQQLRLQLEAGESARQGAERRLQLQVGELKAQEEALHRELRQARLEACDAAELMEARQRVGSELLRCQGEFSEARHQQQQDRLWALQLEQENERLAADLRAAGAYAQSLQAELRGTGERATDHHARCCDLWVALESERLESQRLREAVDLTRREYLTLSQSLQRREEQQHYHPERFAPLQPAVDAGEVPATLPGRRSLPLPSAASGSVAAAAAAPSKASQPSRSPTAGVLGGGSSSSGGGGGGSAVVGTAAAAGPRFLGGGGHSGGLGSGRGGSAAFGPCAGGPERSGSSSRSGSVVLGGPVASGGPGSSRGGSATFGPSAGGAESSRRTSVAAGGIAASGPGSSRGPPRLGGSASVPAGSAAECWGLGFSLGSSLGSSSRSGGPATAGSASAASSAERLGLGGGSARFTAVQAPREPPANSAAEPPAAVRSGGGGYAGPGGAGAGGAGAAQPGGQPEVSDSVSRIMRQGHFPKEAEARRDKQVHSLEKQLMLLNGERQFLESTLMKFPSNTAGRTIAERRQKREAEERLEEVDKTITELRQTLRRVQEGAA